MATALILSSHVASSRVGGFVQALALAGFGIDPVLVPTVVYGRHPGWGAPGGARVPIGPFQGMLDAIQANGLYGRVDLVLTGYMGSPAQVLAAAAAIDAVRAHPRELAARAPIVLVDPVMGDDAKGLYIRPETADAIAAELAPRADVLAPNAWELARLTGEHPRDPHDFVPVCRALGRQVLVSSVRHGEEIGVVYVDARQAWYAAHMPVEHAPNGSGDLLLALFAAALLEGQPVSYALARAVGGVAEAVSAAHLWNTPELPVVGIGQRLRTASPSVRMERLA